MSHDDLIRIGLVLGTKASNKSGKGKESIGIGQQPE